MGRERFALATEYYALCFEAILVRKQLVFTYRDRRRELCPHVLGYTKGKEMLLGYQFGGETNSGLPPEGEWRCFHVAEMHSISVREGDWHTGEKHASRHTCVELVDLDVNPQAPQRSWARHRR
jgi:predicted DNA-binding transcriptional regulator YafY